MIPSFYRCGEQKSPFDCNDANERSKAAPMKIIDGKLICSSMVA